MKKTLLCLLGIGLLGAKVDLGSLAPTPCTVIDNVMVCVEGNFEHVAQRWGRGFVDTIATSVPDEPIILHFSGVSLVGINHLMAADYGYGCFKPELTWCGVNTQDLQSHCQDESRSLTCATVNYGFSTPFTDEWVITRIELTNIEVMDLYFDP